MSKRTYVFEVIKKSMCKISSFKYYNWSSNINNYPVQSRIMLLRKKAHFEHILFLSLVDWNTDLFSHRTK